MQFATLNFDPDLKINRYTRVYLSWDNHGGHSVLFVAGSLLLVATVAGFPMVLFKPPVPEVDTDVEKTGETTRSVRVRMKGESCHT